MGADVNKCLYILPLSKSPAAVCVFPELCLWIPSANFNGEKSAAIQSPYKVNVCHFDFIEKLEKQIGTSFFHPLSLSRRDLMSLVNLHAFSIRVTLRGNPSCPHPSFIKKGLFLFVFLLCHKRVRAPLVYPRFFFGLMHWHISI